MQNGKENFTVNGKEKLKKKRWIVTVYFFTRGNLTVFEKTRKLRHLSAFRFILQKKI
jgi:hypothetical protein